ncbi:triple tyrosine motif-containing protein, partial [Bacteroidota bacterium]
SRGRILAGNQGDFGYFFPDSTQQLSYFSIGNKVPGVFTKIGEIQKIFQIDEALYFCTPSHIYIYEGGIFSIITLENSLGFSDYIDNRVFIQENGKGLMILRETSPISFPGGEVFRDKEIVSMVKKDMSVLIATHQDGLYYYDGVKFNKWPQQQSNPVKGLSINCAISLDDGRIALGTQNHGIILLDSKGELELDINKKAGLLGNTVLSLFQDKHNNIWAGLNSGIALIEISSPFTLLNDNIGIEGTGYSACAHGEYLYLGSNIGAYRSNLSDQDLLDFDLNFIPIAGIEGLVNHITSNGKGVLISHDNGIYDVRGLMTYSTIPIPSVQKTCILSDDHDIMACNYEGLHLIRNSEQGITYQNKLDGINHSGPTIVKENDRIIWMTYGYGGVYKLEIGEEKLKVDDIIYYQYDDKFPSDRLINIFSISDELIFTTEDGIYQYDLNCDCFKTHPYAKILGEDIVIKEMKEDSFGSIYFIAEEKSGVLWFDNLGKAHVTTDLFQKIDGLLNDDAYNITVIDKFNILYGGKEGFIHYNPTRNYTSLQEFDILLRKVELISMNDSLIFGGNFIENGQIKFNQTKSQVITLPNQDNDLRFSYSAAYFDGFEHLRYRYILQNFDKELSSWTSNTYKEYTNLPKGIYTFRVQAQNIYGIESNVYSYTFRIALPWYKKPYAYISYFLGGLAILTLTIFFVDKRYKQEKAELITRQNKRLSEKESEMKVIEAEKNAEITRLSHDKLETEIKYKNQELASSTMNLISKNEVIAGIKQKLIGILKKDQNPDTKKSINKIIKEIDSNISIDEDWTQFEFHFDEVHGDFSNRMKVAFPDLSPQEMKLCAYLRLNLSSKEIAQLLNISIRGVEIARYRLRKKLNLERHANLSDFILNF